MSFGEVFDLTAEAGLFHDFMATKRTRRTPLPRVPAVLRTMLYTIPLCTQMQGSFLVVDAIADLASPDDDGLVCLGRVRPRPCSAPLFGVMWQGGAPTNLPRVNRGETLQRIVGAWVVLLDDPSHPGAFGVCNPERQPLLRSIIDGGSHRPDAG